MNWDAIGAIAELLGAIGVIASLVYLATQIREAREQIQARPCAPPRPTRGRTRIPTMAGSGLAPEHRDRHPEMLRSQLRGDHGDSVLPHLHDLSVS